MAPSLDPIAPKYLQEDIGKVRTMLEFATLLTQFAPFSISQKQLQEDVEKVRTILDSQHCTDGLHNF